MAYEFTPMSEVEVSAEPAETSHVFIEEGGVVKRAPLDKVGGTSGLVVNITSENATKDGDMYTVTDNYDTIYETILAGGSVIFKIQGSLVGYPLDVYSPMILGMLNDGSVDQSVLGFLAIVLIEIQLYFPNGSYHTPAATE